LLKIESLSKSFDGFMAVSDVNLEVEKGEIVAVIGPNGAGKTTLFNLISGVLKPTGGKVFFKGENITGLPPHAICKKGISRSFQIVNVFERMTVFENVQISIMARERMNWNFITPSAGVLIGETAKILESVGLLEKKDTVCGLLSHGDRKVLEIAVALGVDPEFLILDEPTAGMAPEETGRCIDLIKGLSDTFGLTILFCEHDMELVFAIANRIMVMTRGATLVQGSCEEVRCNQLVQDAYLGGSDVC